MSRNMTKPTTWHVRLAKTQISFGIRPDWSESSLSAWRKLGSLATHWAHSEDSDQTGRMPRLIWVFAGRTCHFVGFDMRQLKCLEKKLQIYVPCRSRYAIFWSCVYSFTRVRSVAVVLPWLFVYYFCTTTEGTARAGVLHKPVFLHTRPEFRGPDRG